MQFYLAAQNWRADSAHSVECGPIQTFLTGIEIANGRSPIDSIDKPIEFLTCARFTAVN